MRKYDRKSIRLKGWDYATAGAYFVTVCTQNRVCLFGEIKKGRVILNPAGEMVWKWWNELNNKFESIDNDEAVVMPNHFHGIIIINNDTPAGGTALCGRPSGAAACSHDAALCGRPENMGGTGDDESHSGHPHRHLRLYGPDVRTKSCENIILSRFVADISGNEFLQKLKIRAQLQHRKFYMKHNLHICVYKDNRMYTYF